MDSDTQSMVDDMKQKVQELETQKENLEARQQAAKEELDSQVNSMQQELENLKS